MVTYDEPRVQVAPSRPAFDLTRWRPLLPAALVALSFAPILALHFRTLWSRPHYHLFPLVVPGAILLARRQRPSLRRLQPGSFVVGTVLAAVCWVMLALSVLFVSPIGGAAAALATMMSAAYVLGGVSLVRLLGPAWLILLLAVPLPKSVDARLVASMQNGVSRWASATLDSVGAYHAMEGNVVEIGGRRLLVDQACSGINSLFTLVFGTLLYVLWEKLSAARGVVLMAVSIFWVMVGNMARIVAVVVISTRTGIDASTGWTHWTLGLVAFGAMLGMVASTDRLLAFVGALLSHLAVFVLPRSWVAGTKVVSKEGAMVESLVEANAMRTKSGTKHRMRRTFNRRSGSTAQIEGPVAPVVAEAPTTSTPPVFVEPVPDDGPPGQTVWQGVARSWLGSWPVAAAFGVLFVPQMMMPSVSWADILGADESIPRAFEGVGLDALPDRSGEFRRQAFHTENREDNNSWGEHSRVWSYAFGSRPAAVSLDYQFVGWHDLGVCYQGSGWVKTGEASALAPDSPTQEPTVVTADFYNLEGRHGLLIYSLFDRSGTPLVVPGREGFMNSLTSRLAHWTRPRNGYGGSEVTPTYQFQVFVNSESPLSPEERAAVREFFDKTRATVQSPATKGAKS